jgi:hypothetical protein
VRELSEKDPAQFVLKVWRRNKRFGVAFVPMQMMWLQVMNDPDRRIDFDCFEEYHAYYKSVERVPRHPRKNRWPIFLSGRGRERETIIDGWHRFHSYVDSQAKEVPIIWYADE